MNKKNIYIIIGLAVIIAVGDWFIIPRSFWKADVKQVGVVQEKSGKEAVLTINYGEKPPATFSMNFTKGMTAFDLLKNETDKSGLNLKTKAYDIGTMITAIGDKENGQDGKYWLYYVNGSPPMVSADKEELKAGDTVEFKFEKSIF